MANALARVAGLLLVVAFPARKQEEETQVNMTVQCQLTVFGHRFPECDITARAIGIGSTRGWTGHNRAYRRFSARAMVVKILQ